MMSTREFEDWASAPARFKAVTVLPSPAAALVTCKHLAGGIAAPVLHELTQRTVLIRFERDRCEKADKGFCQPEALVRSARDRFAVGSHRDQPHAAPRTIIRTSCSFPTAT
jgi:hypothetical protein